MKCLILAGGRGERLWPLSRGNFPKQFIKVQQNHSIFQETVARNLPYCDEFIIVTNYEYRFIIENQMDAFHGVPYRCIYEEEPRKTTSAITLACLSLQPLEYVFIVAADHLIDTSIESDGEKLSYRDAILRAKELAAEDKIVLFGKKTAAIDSRFGYITDSGFYEKPDKKTSKIINGKVLYQNLGLVLFQNGMYLNELSTIQPEIFNQIKAAFAERTALPEGALYSKKALESIEPIAIEKALLEKTDHLECIEAAFGWSDVGQLEDLENTGITTTGVGVVHEGTGSVIVNQSPHQAVVVNDLDNVFVVNTTDAVYVGRRGKSNYLKEILHNHRELEQFSDRGMITYRPWGYYEQITEENNYRIRRVVLLPGKTIYAHRHEERKENWTVIGGTALISLEQKTKSYSVGDNIEVPAGTSHQISNAGEVNLVLIETAVGEVLHGGDILSGGSGNLTETDLGLNIDAMVKMAPAYKDYLWGGTKLRDIYGKKCDFDVIAESWELSAHPAGNSIVASGRHKGLSFSRYLESVGKSVLGWKCMQDFPLLIKFIDAKQNLSVQVHPDDDYALSNENEYGKNEMWYVVEAEEGAGLYVGFNRQVSRSEVESRIQNNSILDIMNFFQTHPGDVFFIPAGTVHAIGAGNLICEIQQSSNSTYRLYDYNRRDKFGNQRELHLQKALDVLNYQKYVPGDFTVENTGGHKTVRCKYFETTLLHVEGEERVPLADDSFYSVVCISGEGIMNLAGAEDRLVSGESLFIPATDNLLTINGYGTFLLTRV